MDADPALNTSDRVGKGTLLALASTTPHRIQNQTNRRANQTKQLSGSDVEQTREMCDALVGTNGELSHFATRRGPGNRATRVEDAKKRDEPGG